jgi:hypothetical protein
VRAHPHRLVVLAELDVRVVRPEHHARLRSEQVEDPMHVVRHSLIAPGTVDLRSDHRRLGLPPIAPEGL